MPLTWHDIQLTAYENRCCSSFNLQERVGRCGTITSAASFRTPSPSRKIKNNLGKSLGSLVDSRSIHCKAAELYLSSSWIQNFPRFFDAVMSVQLSCRHISSISGLGPGW
jgi:hypothetical protein